MVWFGFVVAVEAILQAYLSPGKVFGLFQTGYHDFVMGPIVYHTHFAVFIEALLPIALFLALNEAAISYTMVGFSAVLLTAIVVSASRGGLVIACAEVIVVLVLSHLRKPKTGRKIAFVALALIGVTVVFALIVGFETVSKRFYSETLTFGRLQFAISTLHMIAAHPWIGWGLGCWPAVYPAFATFDPGAIVNQAHCDWLQWTAEGGLPVGFAMLSLTLWGVKPAIRSIWGIGVIAVLIHAAFDYPFSRPAVGAWPILILAMAAAAHTRITCAQWTSKNQIQLRLLRADGRRFTTTQPQSHADNGSSCEGHDDDDLRRIVVLRLGRRGGGGVARLRRGAGFWSRAIGRNGFNGRRRSTSRRSVCRWSPAAYLAQRHLVNIRYGHHSGSSLRRRCIENAARGLDRRSNKIIKPRPLKFVGNVCRLICKQIVPIAPRMVLTENAMQRQLRRCRRCGLSRRWGRLPRSWWGRILLQLCRS